MNRIARTPQWIAGCCVFIGLVVALSLSWERNAMATACSLMDLVCYCESDGECTGGTIKGCVGVPVREMTCGTGSATCLQYVGCQGFTNNPATLCALSGPEYRCSNHPGNGGNLEQYVAACQDCTGCYDNQTGFSACPSQTICWYPNGTSNDAECGTLAGVTSFSVFHHDGANVIHWSTGTERHNLGFNVYRVKETGGIIGRVNRGLILGAMKSPMGEVYRITDGEGRPDDLYRLEWLDHDGTAHSRGPVAAVTGTPVTFQKRFDRAAIRHSSRLKMEKLEAIGTVSSALTSGECSGLRLHVKEAGLYRIGIDELVATGLDLDGLTANEISLTSKGVAVPFGASGDDALTADDWIEFYGQPGEGPLSAAAVYVLAVDSESHSPLVQAASSPVDGGAFAREYTATVRFEENKLYALTPAIDDFFYWAYIYYDHPEEDFVLSVDDPLTDEGTFLFIADLDGISDDRDVAPDHHQQIYFNGNLVEDLKWDGVGLRKIEKDLPVEWLKNGVNTVTVKTVEDTGSAYDMVAVDGFTLVLRRALSARDDELVFDLSGDDPNVAVAGFSSQDLRAFDVTIPGHPILLTDLDIQSDGDSYTVAFARSAPAKSGTFLVLSDGRLRTPSKMEARYPSDIRSAENGADLLVIAYDAFVSALQPLVELRQEQGLRVKVVTTSEIYDEFGHGGISDDAVKAFIGFARANWQAPPPKSVLLVGDSTNDPKDYLDLGVINYVPSHYVETELWGGATSDNWYVDLDDSGDFDLAVGRLSVTTPDEVQTAVEKIRQYEQDDSAGLAGSKRVILIADTDEPNLGAPFDDVLTALEAEIPSGYETVSIRVADYSGEGEARQRVRAELDKGSLLVVYVGHGSGLSWGSTPVFEAKDVQSLPEGVHQPLAISLSCVNGYFTYPGLDILGEAFVKPAERGAIASWMPGDMGFPSRHEILIRSFVRNLFGENGMSVGEAVRKALNELSKAGGDYDRSIAETFVYLGDPTLTLHTLESGLQAPSGGGGCANTPGTVGLASFVALFLGLFGFMALRRQRSTMND